MTDKAIIVDLMIIFAKQRNDAQQWSATWKEIAKIYRKLFYAEEDLAVQTIAQDWNRIELLESVIAKALDFMNDTEIYEALNVLDQAPTDYVKELFDELTK